jgi:hypothetical protein
MAVVVIVTEIREIRKTWKHLRTCYCTVLYIPRYAKLQCCGSESGIRNRFFRDSGSQTHIFDGLMTNVCVKSTIIPIVLAKRNYNFMIFVATKNGRDPG